jgi:hypothetical protein
MVDIGDMARKLSDLYPKEAGALVNRLKECVLYSGNNSNVSLNGLSIYYIYGGKELGDYALDTYRALNVNKEHANYLESFFSMLISSNNPNKSSRSNSAKSSRSLISEESTSHKDIVERKLTIWRSLNDLPGKYIMTGIENGIDYDMETQSIAKDFLWPSIGGESVCLYKINSTAKKDFYAIPAVLNDSDCNVIVAISQECPEGRIMGVRREDGIIIQKGYDQIVEGDKLAFHYQERSIGDNEYGSEGWYKGKEFTVEGELSIEWKELNKDEDYFYSNLFTDIRKNKFFDELKPIDT